MSYPAIENQVIDRTAWSTFVRDELVPVAADAHTLLALRDVLAGHEEEVTLAEVAQQRDTVHTFLLGGVTEEGEYRDEGLATFISRLLGVQVEHPQQWIAAEREGLAGDEHVTVTETETAFVSFAETIAEEIEAIVRQVDDAQLAGSGDVDALLAAPEKVASLLQKFIEGVVELTANTNPFIFFAYTTRSVTKRYVTEAYPGIADDFDEVARMTGLESLFEPDVSNGEKQAAYTIWGHREDGLLQRLCRVNDAVWEAFSSDEFRHVAEPFVDRVPSPQDQFQDRVDAQLASIGWSYPDEVPVCASPGRIPTSTANSMSDPQYQSNMDVTRSLLVDGGTITGREVITSVNTSSIRHKRRDLEQPVSLFGYLDRVMPAMFLGAYSLELRDPRVPGQGVRVYQ